MKVLYFDLETSPCLGWFWRPSHQTRLSYDNVLEDARIICASWKWGHEKHVHNAHWGKKKNDAKVLRPLIAAMNEADLIIAHNGDRFDIPWVRARALFHGIKNLPRWRSLDTLKSVRGNLKLPSNRLNDIAKYYGIGKKIPTDSSLWRNVVFEDQSRMEEMLDYCDQDVRLLQQVHEFIEGVVPHKIHQGVVEGKEKWSCPHCGSKDLVHEKERPTASGTMKHQMKCKSKSCGKYFTISEALYISYLKHRVANA